MDRKALFSFGVGLAVIGGILLIVYVLSGGIPSELEADYRQTRAQQQEARQRSEQSLEAYRQSLERHPKVFAKPGPVWTAELEQAETALQQADSALEQAAAVVESNDADRIDELLGRLQEAASKRQEAVFTIARITDAASELATLYEQRDELVAKAHEQVGAVQEADLSPVREAVEQAQRDWPEKQADLEQRWQGFAEDRRQMAQHWAEVESLDAQDPADIDYQALKRNLTGIENLHQRFTGRVTSLPQLIDQLYTGWDQILIDMAIDEGELVTFRQQLRVITTRVPRGEGEPEISTKERWTKVGRSAFEAEKDLLGMSIARKPPGKYNTEEERTAEAPGYAYIASPQQERNRYGHWQHGPSGSFWIWYGQFALMRNMLYGGSYHGIGINDYRNYDRYRSSGRTYYGQGPGGDTLYGSQGSQTKASYRNSRYVQTGGFRNTQYTKSGGSYRGSRFSSRSTSSRSSRGSYSGGSRSYGGK